MNRDKKFYATPEVEIEKFTVYCANSISYGDAGGLEGNENEYVGGDDWDF